MTRRKDLMKKHYCGTLLELCEEKPLAEVTASDVINRAGTARQAFYNHFKDINDLVSYLPIEFVDNASKSVYDSNGVRTAYNFAAAHKGFFSQLPCHSGQNSFRSTFYEWMVERYEREYLTDGLPAGERLKREIAIIQYCSGVVDSFLAWCKGGLEWPVDVLEEVQQSALPAFVTNDGRA